MDRGVRRLVARAHPGCDPVHARRARARRARAQRRARRLRRGERGCRRGRRCSTASLTVLPTLGLGMLAAATWRTHHPGTSWRGEPTIAERPSLGSGSEGSRRRGKDVAMRPSYGSNVDSACGTIDAWLRGCAPCIGAVGRRCAARAARRRAPGSGGTVLARRRSGCVSRRRRCDRPGGGAARVGRLPRQPRTEPCRPGAPRDAAEAPQGGGAQGQGRRVVRAAQPYAVRRRADGGAAARRATATPGSARTSGSGPGASSARAQVVESWLASHASPGEHPPHRVHGTSASPASARTASSASRARRSGSRRSRARSASSDLAEGLLARVVK